MSLSTLISNALTPYRTDPRVGSYLPPGNLSGVPAIARLPHPTYGFTFPPEAVGINGVELVHVVLPAGAKPMLNSQGKFCREHQLWIKAWEWSDEVAEEIACELFQTLSPNALLMSKHPANEKQGTPNCMCIHLKEWVLLR